MSQARGAAAAIATAGILLLGGCVAPASTTADYEADAAMTAQDAVSAARTAVLAAQTYAEGDLPATYLEPTLVDAESALGAVQHSFDSIQPPATAAADDLRAELDPLLDDAGAAATAMRIAARRDRTDALTAAAEQLAATADELDAFAEEHAP